MQVDLTKATQHTEYSFAVHSIIALQHNGRSFQHRILHQFYQIHSIPNLSLGARMPTNTTNTLSASFLTHFIGLLFIATATPRLFLHKAHDSNNKYDSKNCHCRDQDHPQYDVLITWNMIWDIFLLIWKKLWCLRTSVQLIRLFCWLWYSNMMIPIPVPNHVASGSHINKKSIYFVTTGRVGSKWKEMIWVCLKPQLHLLDVNYHKERIFEALYYNENV